MFKWLLLLAGAYLFYRWLKGKKQIQAGRGEAHNPRPNKAPKAIEPEGMVQCQHCKVHLPKSEAKIFEERFYCSKEHLNAIDQQGWVGSAKWRPSPNQDVRPENISPDLVVIHHISLPPSEFRSTNSSQYIIDFFQNQLDSTAHPYFEEIAGQKVSSHFLITRTGELIQFVSTQNKAWHAGVSSFMGREKCNDFSIGIELEGDGETPFEEAQYQALNKLIPILEACYANLQFAGHSDIAPDRKTDPGMYFDWKKFQKETNVSLKNLPYGLTSR
ncbi:1,6-anhydro-N-acetylmuramyl-L-alanine amidase AmpD [Polynucleobacter sp. MWH-UH2A]|uniref:1,6-anhydro-N-acetylmuramyl-L-alanine amidase AmpD n=1 Tax=Polynucleobacter sp. MWH-UH2A TaxID=1855617 RepID=UPI0021126F00|nr:1,6-anhydro-N-acetylmuramyl-L-alanine amidase AmpD [Polynucleobacter sp. MWH-UH2A]